jgi:hypothetical protein
MCLMRRYEPDRVTEEGGSTICIFRQVCYGNIKVDEKNGTCRTRFIGKTHAEELDTLTRSQRGCGLDLNASI